MMKVSYGLAGQDSTLTVSLVSDSLDGSFPHSMELSVGDLSLTESTHMTSSQSKQQLITDSSSDLCRHVLEKDKNGKPILKVFLPGSTSEYFIVEGSQVNIAYEGQAPRHSKRATKSSESSDYLNKFWIGKTVRREQLIQTLSTTTWWCSDKDLAVLSRENEWVGDNPINCFLHLVTEQRPDSGFLSTFFYAKLSNALQNSKSEAELEAELNLLCRWIMKTGVRKKQYFFPININDDHWVFVRAEPTGSPESIQSKRKPKKKATRPQLIYHDSYGGHLQCCLDDLEIFFQHLGGKIGCPELMVSWEKKSEKVPFQHDGWNCGLFVCAAVDCMSSGICPAGYETSTMTAFRAELVALLKEAGHGGL